MAADNPCTPEFVDAPFCRGDSVIECWDHSQVPQGELCPPEPEYRIDPIPGPEVNSCELDGTCDHTDPIPGTDCEVTQRSARGYCPGDEEGHRQEQEAMIEIEPAEATTTAPAPEELEQLPVTGPDMLLSLTLTGSLLLSAGVALLRR